MTMATPSLRGPRERGRGATRGGAAPEAGRSNCGAAWGGTGRGGAPREGRGRELRAVNAAPEAPAPRQPRGGGAAGATGRARERGRGRGTTVGGAAGRAGAERSRVRLGTEGSEGVGARAHRLVAAKSGSCAMRTCARTGQVTGPQPPAGRAGK